MHSYFASGQAFVFLAMQIWVTYRAKAALQTVEQDWRIWVRDHADRRRGRDELLRHLDHMVLNDFWRLMLKRFSVMAPLFGVYLTATGFMMLNLNAIGDQTAQNPEGNLVFSDALQALRPLYVGVLAGALLAVVNQLLLQALDYWGLNMRRQLEMHAVATTAEPINEALSEFCEVIRGISDDARSRLSLAVIDAESQVLGVTRSVAGAAKALESVRADYEDQRKSLKNATKELHDATSAAANATLANTNSLKESIGTMSRQIGIATNELKKMESGFDTTVSKLAKSIDGFEPLAPSLAAQIVLLTKAAGSFQSSSEVALKQARQVGADLSNHLKPALEKAATDIATVSLQCGKASESLSKAGEKLDRSAGQIDTRSEQLKNSTTNLVQQLPEVAKTVQSLADSIQRQEALLSSTPKQLVALLKSVEMSLSNNVDERIKEIGESVTRGIAPSITNAAEKLDMAAEQCSQNTRELISVSQTLDKSAKSVHNGSRYLTTASDDLSKHMSQLEQQISNLANRVGQQKVTLPDELVGLLQSIEASIPPRSSGRSKKNPASATKSRHNGYDSSETAASSEEPKELELTASSGGMFSRFGQKMAFWRR